jgi:hypothetical protein
MRCSQPHIVIPILVGVAGAIVGSSSIALGAETYNGMQMTTCPPFTATTWSNWMPPNDSGNRYIVTLTTAVKVVGGKKALFPPMTCAQAQTWVKKLVAERIAGKPGLAQYPPLKTGPPNFVCKGSPDNHGHAWRGTCLETTRMTPTPSISWTDD